MSRAFRELRQRVERIEQGTAKGPLSKAEVAELEGLEAESTRYTAGIDDMTGDQLDDALAYLLGHIGNGERLTQLRHRSGYFDDQEED